MHPITSPVQHQEREFVCHLWRSAVSYERRPQAEEWCKDSSDNTNIRMHKIRAKAAISCESVISQVRGQLRAARRPTSANSASPAVFLMRMGLYYEPGRLRALDAEDVTWWADYVFQNSPTRSSVY